VVLGVVIRCALLCIGVVNTHVASMSAERLLCVTLLRVLTLRSAYAAVLITWVRAPGDDLRGSARGAGSKQGFID
jgi:hypothetical protein